LESGEGVVSSSVIKYSHQNLLLQYFHSCNESHCQFITAKFVKSQAFCLKNKLPRFPVFFVFIVLSLENIAHKYIMGMIGFYVQSKRSFGYSLLFERANIINLSADVKEMLLFLFMS
jgi:hypothetical protein